MKIYLTSMAIRLYEMKRILKPTGSLYLHCDPTASHYLKLIMDSLFGRQNFRNEIVWCYWWHTDIYSITWQSARCADGVGDSRYRASGSTLLVLMRIIKVYEKSQVLLIRRKRRLKTLLSKVRLLSPLGLSHF
jgi:hypothetical protein